MFSLTRLSWAGREKRRGWGYFTDTEREKRRSRWVIFTLTERETTRGEGAGLFTLTRLSWATREKKRKGRGYFHRHVFFCAGREKKRKGAGLFSPTLSERRRGGGGVIFTGTSFLEWAREKEEGGRGYFH